MVHKPPLPDEKQLPRKVNGWIYDPTNSRNGHTWVGKETVRSVTVYKTHDRIRVTLYDDRVDHGGKVDYIRREIDEIPMKPTNAVWWGVKNAVGWMKQTDPTAWEHPEIEPAVFSPPPGYKVANYAIRNRAYIIYYERKTEEEPWEMIGTNLLSQSEPSIETRTFPYIKCWKGSGNCTIALAPWLRADEHEMEEIIKPPDNCGLEAAINLTHKWVKEHSSSSLPTDKTYESIGN